MDQKQQSSLEEEHKRELVGIYQELHEYALHAARAVNGILYALSDGNVLPQTGKWNPPEMIDNVAILLVELDAEKHGIHFDEEGTAYAAGDPEFISRFLPLQVNDDD